MLRSFIRWLSAIALVSCSLMAEAQTVVTSGSTISTTGSYILTSNVTGITITGNNVTIDLNGFAIRSTPTFTCSLTAGVAGNSCSGSPSSTSALTISGDGVLVKNGAISNGSGLGIQIGNASGTREDVTLQNLRINNFKGDCVQDSAPGLVLDDVTISACGGNGVLALKDESIFRNVIASNNNGSGINSSGSAIFENVHATWNGSVGIVADPGTAVRVSVANNLSTGLGPMGVVKDSLSYGNGLYGVYAPFASLVRDTYSRNNGSADFNLSADTCYFALVADSAGSIVSGVPLVGSTAACF